MLSTNDTFTDTAGTLLQSHTGETGATWIKHPNFATGSAVIGDSGTRVRGNANASTIYYASGVPGSADYDVEADLYVASLAHLGGIMGRLSTSASTYYLLDYENGSSWLLYSVVAGTTQQSKSFAQVLTVGQTVHVRLCMRGSLITAYVNGVQILQMTDSNVTATGTGGVFFSAADTDSTGPHLDNFQVSTPAATIAVTDGSVFFSPYNWYSDGAGGMAINNVKGSSTYALAQNCGAYGIFSFAATSSGYATLLLDTTSLNGITAANCPTLYVSLDNLAPVTWLLGYSASTIRVLLGDGLASGTHTIQWWIKSIDTTSATSMGDRWNNPLVAGASAVKVIGVEMDGKGSSTGSYAQRGKNLLVFADSMAEGVDALASGNTNASTDATQAFSQLIGQALGAEVGSIGFAGQGYASSFSYGNVPKIVDTGTPANSTWNHYWSGKSRLISSALGPSPDYILIVLGKNDAALSASDASVTAAVTALLQAIRAAAAGAWIFVGVPFDASKKSAITSGFNAAADPKAKLIDVENVQGMSSGGILTNDGTHPNARGHATFAAAMVAQIRTALDGSASFAGSTGNFVGGAVQLTDGAFAV